MTTFPTFVIKAGLAALALVMAVCIGCSADPPAWQQADAQPVAKNDDDTWQAMASAKESRVTQRTTGGVTAVASQRPSLVNVGVQLPRVSPDGEWVAFLDQDDQLPPASPDSLITGRGLESLSLWLTAPDTQGIATVISLHGVAWPTWSPDSQQLLFINHDEKPSASLGIHDIRSGKTSRKSPGLRHMMMPAFSPDSRQIAVAAYGEMPDQSLIFIIDLVTGQATPGPKPISDGAQIFPCWVDFQTLLYIELSSKGASLMRWQIGAEPQVIAPMDLPESVFDAQHTLAGIAQPLSPDSKTFAWYSQARDRVVLTDLSTGQSLSLREGTRAGAWWGSSWFIAARDERVELVEYQPDDHDEESSVQAPRGLHLLPGRWIPLWSDASEQSMLLAGQSDRPDRFAMLQLWVVTRKD